MYKDQKSIDLLKKIKQENFALFRGVAAYLNEFPCLINKEIMDEIVEGVSENEELSFALFLATALSGDDDEAKLFEREYLKKSVKKLDAGEYRENPYFKNIVIPNKKVSTWELGYQAYQPYEGFIYDDIDVLDDYREIPKVGFFSEKFSFPTVFEDGVEWMAIKPNEIETMKPHIEKMSGDVCVFGLGIGYFAYMVSEKSDVTSVTIVERDSSVINLFEKYILPQFSRKDKIKIIKSDAFDFAKKKMPDLKFDCAFVDLWHDVSDGVELYIKMKKLEDKNPNTKFSYWIEKSILSNIRWHIFDGIEKRIESGDFVEPFENVKKYISDDYLKNFVKFL
ncbi:MAG: hypothetical protein IJD42_02035 [Clostridia bacterium]|nr:hypothetical protein [Clostridia bacterium]